VGPLQREYTGFQEGIEILTALQLTFRGIRPGRMWAFARTKGDIGHSPVRSSGGYPAFLAAAKVLPLAPTRSPARVHLSFGDRASARCSQRTVWARPHCPRPGLVDLWRHVLATSARTELRGYSTGQWRAVPVRM